MKWVAPATNTFVIRILGISTQARYLIYDETTV